MHFRMLAVLVTAFLMVTSVCFGQVATLQEGDFAGVLFGTVWTDDGFDNTRGGVKFGAQTVLDHDKGLWLRTIYSQYNFDPEPMRTLQTAAMLDWYVGKRWKAWFLTGVDSYLAGDNSGADLFGGFGLSRRMLTFNNVDRVIPANLDLFAEFSFTDADEQQTGNFMQVNIGVVFNAGKRR